MSLFDASGHENDSFILSNPDSEASRYLSIAENKINALIAESISSNGNHQLLNEIQQAIVTARKLVQGKNGTGSSTRPENFINPHKVFAPGLKVSQEPQPRVEQPSEDQDRWRILADGTAMLIWTTDAQGEIELVNEAFANFFGVPVQEGSSLNWRDFVHPNDVPGYIDVFEDCLKSRRDFRAEGRIKRHDGQWRWVETLGQPRFSESGEFSGMTNSSLDITDLKRTENYFAEANAELRFLNDLLEEGVQERTKEIVELQQKLMDMVEAERTRLAHEIHDGPMQDIYGISYFIAGFETASLPQKIQEAFTTIQDGILHVNHTLRNITQDLLPPILDQFGLEKAIREHVTKIAEAHPAIKIDLDLQYDGEMLAERNRLAFYRIYQTMISNVIRHSLAEHVEIHFYHKDDCYFLEIEDDGVGFEVQKNWMGYARKGHMGLVSARERAQSMGGNLEIDSAPGKGTRMRVTVPVAASQ